MSNILGETLHLGDLEKALRAGRIVKSADVNNDGRICECGKYTVFIVTVWETVAPPNFIFSFG